MPADLDSNPDGTLNHLGHCGLDCCNWTPRQHHRHGDGIPLRDKIPKIGHNSRAEEGQVVGERRSLDRVLSSPVPRVETFLRPRVMLDEAAHLPNFRYSQLCGML